jgi:hypothetical protein
MQICKADFAFFLTKCAKSFECSYGVQCEKKANKAKKALKKRYSKKLLRKRKDGGRFFYKKTLSKEH